MASSRDFPKWFVSYPTFTTELQCLFRPWDPVADATNMLEALKYKDNTKAARYTIEFNRHAHHTGWNEVALAHQYYKGLLEHLKDEIACIGKPTELHPLQELVATLDQCYCQSEISRGKRTTSNTNPPNSQNKLTPSDNRTDKSSGNQNTSGSKSNTNNQSKNKDQKKAAPAANANNTNPGNKTNNISDLLGPDSKLKPEERQRRMDNNLCLRCSKSGHIVPNCPTTSKAKPKGCTATVSTLQTTATAAAASGLGKA